jgi:LacI family transcriptional regulator
MDDPARRTHSVTLSDVARQARVSRATAARVLGGYGVASAEARSKVMAAARELGYRPNELARSMITGRSGIIGVVVGDIENPFFSLAVRGISDVAHAAGFTVILANSGERIEAERSVVSVMLGKRVDGLIVTPSRSDDPAHLVEVIGAGLPLVLLDRTIPGLPVDAVTTDDREAAIAATRLLIEHGHRRIAYVTAAVSPGARFSDASEIPTESVRARVGGLIETCRAAGIAEPERFVRLNAVDAEHTRAITHELLQGPERPSAIIASDSVIGLEVFRAVRDLGIAVPDELSLVTFHNADWTGVTTPPVAVIDQPVYELGRKAAELVIRRLRDRNASAGHVVLATRLLPRGSVGPAGQ